MNRSKQSLFKVDLRFPQLPEASPDPILITDAKSEIYYVNSAWEKLTGYTFQEVKGKNPRLLQSGKTPKKVYKNLWRALSKGKAFNTSEIINRKKSGKEFQVHAIYFPIIKEGETVYYVQMFHDITRLIELEKQKDAFIGIASHELKTPITSLYVYAQILEKSLDKKGDVKDKYLLSNITRETKRLTNLIDDLLNVSRLESGKLILQHEEFDINTLIKQIIIDFQYTNETHELKREGSINSKVIGDKDRIEQVFINLITNAIKYSPNADKVLIHVAEEKNDVVISVQDFGLGIGVKDQPHVFKRFYRTPDKEERKITGFGLGLYIASEIIKRHKGKIWVKSQKGKGSTFFFTLPLK